MLEKSSGSSLLQAHNQKRRDQEESPPSSSWIVSFADMVTIVLTFLVMIVGITTQDPHSLPSYTALDSSKDFEGGDVKVDVGGGAALYSNLGVMAPVIKLAENYDQLPKDIMFDQAEIKNAMFQLQASKSPDYEQAQEALSRGVSIFKDNRGLVVSWDQQLLFPEGSSVLITENIMLLQKMAAFLKSINLLVSVEGHSNPSSSLEGGAGSPQAYALAMSRARTVMDYLTSLGVAEKRFRIKSYGGTRPLAVDGAGGANNSRLELVLYKPEKTSWLGR